MNERVIRLAVDINVFVADILARRHSRHGTACMRIIDAVRAGACPAGPVQLITSVPIIENFADVLRRRLGYDDASADERAWIVQEYAVEGPLPSRPLIVVGSGYIPFASEEQMAQSVQAHLGREGARKLFGEIQDDRYVLETALAGPADILVTCNIADFRKGPAVELQRKDVILFPVAARTLIVATPQFTAHWFDQGIIPDVDFIADHLDEFAPRDTPGHGKNK